MTQLDTTLSRPASTSASSTRAAEKDATGAGEAECSPRLGRRRDHTRDGDILAAALDVLAEMGYDGMTVDMVAARAKAGKATLYRRWPSKAELVIDAVACMKRADAGGAPQDTGSLRGDLLATIRPHSVEETEKKLEIMAGIASAVNRSPELAAAVKAAIIEPRAALNRTIFQRAVARGEITADHDFEILATLMPAMTTYRMHLLKQPADRDFLVSLIDEVLLPALGVQVRQLTSAHVAPRSTR